MSGPNEDWSSRCAQVHGDHAPHQAVRGLRRCVRETRDDTLEPMAQASVLLEGVLVESAT